MDASKQTIVHSRNFYRTQSYYVIKMTNRHVRTQVACTMTSLQMVQKAVRQLPGWCHLIVLSRIDHSSQVFIGARWIPESESLTVMYLRNVWTLYWFSDGVSYFVIFILGNLSRSLCSRLGKLRQLFVVCFYGKLLLSKIIFSKFGWES